MLDGDIWLLDLFTGESQQLTTDGDNRWPTWSRDGRYLFYTHTEDGERFDLYILDTTQGEAADFFRQASPAFFEQQ